MERSKEMELLRDFKGDPSHLYKVIVIGEAGVGKSSIFRRALSNVFMEQYEITMSAESGTLSLRVGKEVVQLQIWDTAGMERYRSIIRIFFQGAQGAFLVFDLTRKRTFKMLDIWLNILREATGSEVRVFLIGNKSDDKSNRQVEESECKD